VHTRCPLTRLCSCPGQNLSRRGLHGTALETCKLLLALDPGDPLGGLFLVDYLALRSRSYGWLTRFAAEWSPEVSHSNGGGADNGSGGVEMLPNFAFSLALAAFWREKELTGAARSRLVSPVTLGLSPSPPQVVSRTCCAWLAAWLPVRH